jgi:hypothetical protein
MPRSSGSMSIPACFGTPRAMRSPTGGLIQDFLGHASIANTVRATRNLRQGAWRQCGSGGACDDQERGWSSQRKVAGVQRSCLNPGSNNELPLPRLIIAPQETAEVAPCTSAKDANCALLNSIMSWTGLDSLIVCEPAAKLVNTNSSGDARVAAGISLAHVL